jgi:hypothetical protein
MSTSANLVRESEDPLENEFQVSALQDKSRHKIIKKKL